MRRFATVLVPAGLAVAGVLAAAGGAEPRLQARGDTIQPAYDTTVVVRAVGSALEFTPDRISVKTGLRVRLRFVNDGTLPHNVVIPRGENDLDMLVEAAMSAGSTGYVPLAHKDKLLAYTTLASPSETVEMTFVMPPPGSYVFICLYPGHGNVMIGTLRSLR